MKALLVNWFLFADNVHILRVLQGEHCYLPIAGGKVIEEHSVYLVPEGSAHSIKGLFPAPDCLSRFTPLDPLCSVSGPHGLD